MRIFCGTRIDEQEWIDSPDLSPEEIRRTTRDQAVVNRFLGGGRATFAHVFPLLKSCPSEPIMVLDAACGGGDISRAVVDESRKLGRRAEVVALDVNPGTLQRAKEASAGYPEVSFVQGDALHLPFRDAAFDIIMMPTFLHHLRPDEVVTALRSAARASRGKVVAADLRRCWTGRIGILLFARLAGFSRVSAHDGAVSVCRAYSPTELAELARTAGVSGQIYRHPLCRMTLVFDAKP